MLTELALRVKPVALIVRDQRMPGWPASRCFAGMHPRADRQAGPPDGVRLTDAAILAINEIGLDYYFVKPWGPPEERLFPVTDDLLEATGGRPSPTIRASYAWWTTAGRTGARAGDVPGRTSAARRHPELDPPTFVQVNGSRIAEKRKSCRHTSPRVTLDVAPGLAVDWSAKLIGPPARDLSLRRACSNTTSSRRIGVDPLRWTP